MLTFKPGYFLLTLALLIVEVLIALYVRDAVIRPYGGYFLVVMLIYSFLRTFVDRSRTTIALASLALAFAVEFAQLFHLVDLLGLTGNRLAETVIGTGFSFLDLLAYVLGTATAYLLDSRAYNPTANS